MRTLNLHQELQRFLRRYTGASAYLERLWGNHGDRLIVMGAETILSRAQMTLVDHPNQADVIVARGGGFAEAGTEHVLQLFEAYPRVPAVLLPTTFRLPTGYLRGRLANRQAPTAVWAREPTTYAQILEARFDIDAHLGHDTAFALTQTEWLSSVTRLREARHLLVVERGDEETVTGLRTSGIGPGWLKRLLPRPLKETLKRAHRRIVVSRATQSPFASAAFHFLRSNYPDTRSLPLLAADISDTAWMSFDEFVSTVAAAGAVCTTRLHVGILAAMLDKPTVLHGGAFEGRYRKIESVYEHSLKHWPNVVLLTGDSSLM